MKSTILMTALLLTVAATAMAQSGPMKGNAGFAPDPMKVPLCDDKPARPVPEPGTMALASMGLIALGAAARGRRK